MVTPRQSAILSRNSDIEDIPILACAKDGIMSVNFRADRLKRTHLHPLRTDGFNPQLPMKPAIEDAATVDNFKSFLNVQGAIPIYCDPAIKDQDSIGKLGSGDSTAEEGAADEQFSDER